MTREAIAKAARGCVGAPFRPQGRDPANGLDCVGVVILAFGAGLHGPVPGAYPQRGGDIRAIRAAIERTGLRPVEQSIAGEGDLVLLLSGPAQWHLAVLTSAGFVHADARLRRVVETPGRPQWPVIGAWRLEEEN